MKKYTQADIEKLVKPHKKDSGFNIFEPKVGKHVVSAFNQLCKKIGDPKEAEKQLISSCIAMGNCNVFNAPPGEKNSLQGLLVSKVQSGKTSAFAGLTSWAADNKYSIIVHLLGTNHTLSEKNHESIEKQLGLSKEMIQKHQLDWHPVQIGAKGGKSKNKNFSKYGIEESIDQLINRINSRGGSVLTKSRKEKVLYLHLLKKNVQIDKVTNIINYANTKLAQTQNMPVLIVDDEVDFHSVDTGRKKSTRTYKSLLRLKKACSKKGGNVTYVGVTATVAAIILAKFNSFLRPEFHTMLESGKGYVGNKELFGNSKQVLTKSQKQGGKNYRHQPKVINIIDPNTQRESKKLVKESLVKAIADFLISCSFLVERREQMNPNISHYPHMSMELLYDTKIQSHDDVANQTDDILDKFLNALKNKSPNLPYKKLLIDAYNDKKQVVNKKYNTPTQTKALKLIEDILSCGEYQIPLLNMTGPDSIDYDDDSTKLWFVIGGHKLSRGLVIENLMTTWHPYQPDPKI